MDALSAVSGNVMNKEEGAGPDKTADPGAIHLAGTIAARGCPLRGRHCAQTSVVRRLGRFSGDPRLRGEREQFRPTVTSQASARKFNATSVWETLRSG